MLRGYDISAYQSSIPAGGDFEILKATEGLSYDDGPFASRWATLGRAGALRGAYHFAHPSNDPVAEADHFLRIMRSVGIRPGDMLVLDHETPGSSPGHDAAWARAWCAHVEQKTGIRPVVYTFLSFAWEGRCAGLEGYPLWIADPSNAAGQPRVPGPWKSWALHQYSEAGGLDHDVFNGDRAAWLALGGKSPNPTPNPAPVEDDVPYGVLAEGAQALTPIALPKGKFKTIGFTADNGLQGLPPAVLRVALDQGGGNWHVAENVTVDSHKGQTVITFPEVALTDGISVRREDKGDVHVAWVVS